AVGDLEVGAVLPGLGVGVLGVLLARVGRAVAELPSVLERRLAALGVRLELDRERRLALLGLAVGPREQRRFLGLLTLTARDRRRRATRGGGRRRGRRWRGYGGRCLRRLALATAPTTPWEPE